MTTLPLRATFDEDLTAAMATKLRAAGVNLDGPVDDIVRRAFQNLWGPTTGGFTYADIKPRLLDAIDMARRDGAINLSAV